MSGRVRGGALVALLSGAVALSAAPAAYSAHARDGRFSGRTDQRLKGKRGRTVFSVGANGRIIRGLEVDLLYSCPLYGQWATRLKVHRVRIQFHSGIFLKATSFKAQGPGGHRAKVSLRIAGRFTRSVTARAQVRALMAVVTKRGVREHCAAVANIYGARRF